MRSKSLSYSNSIQRKMQAIIYMEVNQDNENSFRIGLIILYQ